MFAVDAGGLHNSRFMAPTASVFPRARARTVFLFPFFFLFTVRSLAVEP